MSKTYRVTKKFEALITAKNEDEAVKIAFEQEFRAIDFIEFMVSAKVEKMK